MIEAAAGIARLAARQPDGATLRDHLAVVARATGRMPDELKVPEVPSSCQSLWDVYGQLAGTVGSNGFARNPLGWRDLAAWQQVMQMPLTPWEAETLVAIDRAIVAQQQPSSSEKHEPGNR